MTFMGVYVNKINERDRQLRTVHNAHDLCSALPRSYGLQYQ